MNNWCSNYLETRKELSCHFENFLKANCFMNCMERFYQSNQRPRLYRNLYGLVYTLRQLPGLALPIRNAGNE